MKIAVIADEWQKEELLVQGLADDAAIEWLTEPMPVRGAEGYIDLQFLPEQIRIDKLNALQPALVIVNSVANPLSELGVNAVRINGWPTFLKRPLAEASCIDESLKQGAEKILSAFNKTIEWIPDIAGFVSPRVISMIINEAYYAQEENVSTKKEIDTAMKLGTNYPYGPFEWSEKIGLRNIYDLLISLSKTNSRYTPCILLEKEALTA